MQLQLRYTTDTEKNEMIEKLSNTITVKKVSKPYRTGKYYRIYLDVE